MSHRRDARVAQLLGRRRLVASPLPHAAQPAPLKLGIAHAADRRRRLRRAVACARPCRRSSSEVNAAGGVLGRQIELVSEDDQTNPEAAVRAARKLIDVDRVAAIMGTWASAVTTAVAPVCWESKTFLTTVSGADTITQLPHQGYLIRTQPNNICRSAKLAEFIVSLGVKKVFILSIQTPFAVPTQNRATSSCPRAAAGRRHAHLRQGQDHFRSEIDQALRTKPDLIYLNGYTPDVTVLMPGPLQAPATPAPRSRRATR